MHACCWSHAPIVACPHCPIPLACTTAHLVSDSPLHHVRAAFVKIPDGDQSIFGYGKLESNATNIKVVNNGHTVQVVSGLLCGGYAARLQLTADLLRKRLRNCVQVFPAGFAPNASVVVRGKS